MDINVGDKVMRYLSSERIPMGPLLVTEIDDKLIHCGPWKFDKEFGYEVDEDLGWGMQIGGPMDGQVLTGSTIEPIPPRLPAPETDPPDAA